MHFRHLQLKHVCQWDVGVGHALFSRKWEARGGAPLNLTRTKAVLAVESGLSLVHFSEQRAMAPPPVYGESCCWDPLGTCTRAQASCNSALLCCRYSTHHWSAETSLTPCNGKTCTSQSLNADVKRVSRKTCTDQISIGLMPIHVHETLKGIFRIASSVSALITSGDQHPCLTGHAPTPINEEPSKISHSALNCLRPVHGSSHL